MVYSKQYSLYKQSNNSISTLVGDSDDESDEYKVDKNRVLVWYKLEVNMKNREDKQQWHKQESEKEQSFREQLLRLKYDLYNASNKKEYILKKKFEKSVSQFRKEEKKNKSQLQSIDNKAERSFRKEMYKYWGEIVKYVVEKHFAFREFLQMLTIIIPLFTSWFNGNRNES
ncbi:23719_t:CDS:2 [Dentiscutata erythropus]|uniref:23719_t:CDS:1 n=1 Tax=Dentiscutata erythropus TaxID=1348616 RepID=A0A9N9EGF2_9GLOM|nr:23719_t:CDS:2 [Dentiscutata erythropus]